MGAAAFAASVAVPCRLRPLLSTAPLLRRLPLPHPRRRPARPPHHQRAPRACAAAPPAAASWTATTGRGATLRDALREAVRAAVSPDAPPALVLAFVAGVRDAAETPRLLRDELRRARVDDGRAVVFGCTAEAVAGEGEGLVCVEVVAACLPGVRVWPFRVGQSDRRVNLDWRQGDWASIVGCGAQAGVVAGTVAGAVVDGEDGGDEDDAAAASVIGPVFLLLSAPEFDLRDLVAGLDFAYPRSPKLGGGAGAPVPAGTGLVFDADGAAYDDGAVGVALERVGPGVVFEVVVAQGARPVGTRMTVQSVRDEVEILKVREETGAGLSIEGPPLQLLDLWTHGGLVDEEDAEGARMYLGVDIPTAAAASTTPEAARAFVIAEDEAKKGGDVAANSAEVPVVDPDATAAGQNVGMLVRRIVGIDVETNTIAVSGPPVRLGVGARFHVRDAASAAAEIERLREVVPRQPIGGLLLTDQARAEMSLEADREAFGENIARLVGSNEIGPLPAPGFQKHFPIREPGSAASTFQHASAAVYLLCYKETE